MEKPHRLACADASPCIALSRLGLLGVLAQIFDEVLVTQAVLIELMDGVSLDDAWLVFREPCVRVVSSAALRKIAVGIPMPPQLGAGERDTIILAHQNRGTAIIDDGHARRVANRLGVRVIGTVGLLLLTKHRGIIEQIRPYLEKLQEAGFRLHPQLVRQALQEAGE